MRQKIYRRRIKRKTVLVVIDPIFGLVKDPDDNMTAKSVIKKKISHWPTPRLFNMYRTDNPRRWINVRLKCPICGMPMLLDVGPLNLYHVPPVRDVMCSECSYMDSVII